MSIVAAMGRCLRKPIRITARITPVRFTSAEHKDERKSINYYEFSKSQYNPEKLSLDANLAPFQNSGKKWKRIIRPLAGIFLIAYLYVIYNSFTSDYDLDVEESLMKALPGYEDDMKKNPKYLKTIEDLREKRQKLISEN